MFRNRHVIIALIVAPVLAMVAWLGVDRAVSEKPHAAREGASYELVAGPDCRYASGQCTLRNGEFRVVLRADDGGDGPVLTLESRFAVDAVRAALVRGEGPPPPQDMIAVSGDGRRWSVSLAPLPPAGATLRLVLIDDGTRYYAETGAVFFEREAYVP